MNVVIVNDFGHVRGGADRVAIDTAKGLAKRGYNVIFFCAVTPIDANLQLDNIEVECLCQNDILTDRNRVRAAIRGVCNFYAAYRFLSVLKKYNPNDTVVHIHTLSKAITSSIIPIAKMMRIKIVYHCHDYGAVCPNLGFYDYQKKEICKCRPMSIECICKNCDRRSYIHKIWRLIRQFVMNCMGIKELDSYIYISNFSKMILNNNGLGQGLMVNLPNYVDVEKHTRVFAEKNDTYVFVGRLSSEKNPEILAEAAKKKGVKVIFVGAGECESRIKKIYSYALITGWKDKSELLEYWHKARALVFPSAWYEGQGLSILEAKSHGIPVICSDACAGKDEFIEDEEGNLFQSNNVDSLVQIIDKFMDDKLVEKYSKNSYYNFWNLNYNDEKYINKLTNIYNSVLS